MYKEEINLAIKFLEDHGYNDPIIVAACEEAADPFNSHSDRWSIFFDVMFEHYRHYPERSKIITGLAYLSDERKI